MALAASSFIQMSLVRTTNYKSSPKKPMTVTITCANHIYKGKRGERSRNGGYGPGPQTNSIKLQSTTMTRNIQLDNTHATTILSSVNDEDDHNTSSPKRIANLDYHYEI
ncbi:uncharacterized protein LOC131647773 [Vicia villosa]|uniref:uncharacterized protein LOC131647773 n=1 Tax=Vicia villosa TaxID=3911 RepID=UPI00273C4F05|nr:uncharacterized protein LOC131647773 [Vicia villosa]